MRTRIAAPVLVGALAAAALAAPSPAFATTTTTTATTTVAATTTTAVGRTPVVTRASMTSFAPGLTGVSQPVLRITARAASGIRSIRAVTVPLAFTAYANAKQVAAAGDSFPTVSRTATTLTVGAVVPFDAAAGQDRLGNAMAGTWVIKVYVVAKDGTAGWVPDAGRFTVKRADTVAVTASATTLRKGGTLTLRGRLNRADWDKGVWTGHAGQLVRLQFRKAGSSTWITQAYARTAADGSLRASARSFAGGSWRIAYPGDSVSGAAGSAPLAVTVK